MKVVSVEKLLYSVREGAAVIGTGKSKMWELVSRGDIESVKVDGLRKIPADALRAYVEGLRSKHSPDRASA